jgi:ketosteroid isomerase-like protein
VEHTRSAELIAELHRRQQAMYAGGPVEPVLELLHPQIVWHVPGRSPIAGDHRGRRVVERYFRTRRDLANATLRMHPGQAITDGQAVVQLVAGTAQLGGRHAEWQTVGVYRIHAGRIAEVWLVPLDLDLFDQLWTPERESSGQQ